MDNSPLDRSIIAKPVLHYILAIYAATAMSESCGTTWISCMAAELLFQISPTNLTEINSMVPDVHDLPEKSTVPAASQYLIKSHCPLNAVHGFPPFGKYRKVIYVIPDPRDVRLSYHRYARYLSNYSGGLKEFAMDWVAGRIWPCSWQEHINSWLAPRFRMAPFELTVFRYEDFVADPIGQAGILAKVLMPCQYLVELP